MMRTSSHAFRASVAAAAMTLFAFAPSAASAQLSSAYFFGDSFTDTGNATGLAALNGLPNPTPPPYAPGRFSNGAVWSEIFAARIGLAASAGPAWLNAGNNYAVGGATTGTTGAYGSATGMLSQGQLFALQHPTGVAANGLFVLWGGGNDILNAVTLGTPLLQQQAIVQAVTNITTLAGYLQSQFGASNFLIPYLPNIGVAPLFAADPLGAATATSLTNAFNQLLAVSVGQLGAFPGVHAYGLSLNNLLTNVLADAKTGGTRYGITNTTTPCLLINVPTACDASLFADGQHPTTRMHNVIANAAYNRVVLNQDVAVVPEPASVVLLAFGLGVTGLVARRRRSGARAGN
jgi:phospholipase/lecithinase/hemolysin